MSVVAPPGYRIVELPVFGNGPAYIKALCCLRCGALTTAGSFIAHNVWHNYTENVNTPDVKIYPKGPENAPRFKTTPTESPDETP